MARAEGDPAVIDIIRAAMPRIIGCADAIDILRSIARDLARRLPDDNVGRNIAQLDGIPLRA